MKAGGAITADLAERDVLGGCYPAGVTTDEDRRRWNQCLLLALGYYRVFEPGALPVEFASEKIQMAWAIYNQDRGQYPTGTDAELVEEIVDARAGGWL